MAYEIGKSQPERLKTLPASLKSTELAEIFHMSFVRPSCNHTTSPFYIYPYIARFKNDLEYRQNVDYKISVH